MIFLHDERCFVVWRFICAKQDSLRQMTGGKQKGSFFGGGGVRPADEEDLFSYFSARCYSGYGDDKQVSNKPTLVGVRSAHVAPAALN